MDPDWHTQILKSTLQENEVHLQQIKADEVELCQTLRLQVEDLQKRLEEKDNKLTQANKVIRALRDEVQTLQQQLEQHRRKYHDDVFGQRGRLCQCGRGNDITTLTTAVLSDCRPSEPEPDSSDAGTSQEDQDVTSQEHRITLLRPSLETNIGSEVCEMPPNIFLYCTSEDDPANISNPPDDVMLTSAQELEEDPADDVPLSPGDGTLTSPRQLKNNPADDVPLSPGDGTRTSPKDLKLRVLSVKLQDCRDMLGPDGVFKMRTEEEIRDDDDDQCYQDDDGDDVDNSPENEGFNICSKDGELLSAAEESIEEPKGQQKRKKRGRNRVKAKTTNAKHHTCTECGQTFSYLSWLAQHLRRKHARRKPSTATPLGNVSTNSPHEYTPNDSAHENARGVVQEDYHPETNGTTIKVKKMQTEEDFSDEGDDDDDDDDDDDNDDDDSDYDPETGMPTKGKKMQTKEGDDDDEQRDHYDDDDDSDYDPETDEMPTKVIKSTERDLCGKTLPTPQTPVSQKRVHTDVPEQGTERKHPPWYWECDVCGKILCNKQSLKIHKRLHTGERPYTCKHCGETFRHYSAFINHRAHSNETHGPPKTGEPPEQGNDRKNPTWECDVCGEILCGKQSLIAHNRLHFGGEKPYACKHCDKAFRYHGNFIKHQRAHPNETYDLPKIKGPPWECDLCGKILCSKQSLIDHKRVHADEKPFVCEDCGKTFSNYSNFRQHQNTHSDKTWECDVCGKIVRHKRSLIYHKRQHTGEKPYACKHCGETFSQHRNFAQHRRTHSNETHGLSTMGQTS
ncbi:zinc finger protein 599-like [Engraulis encrasicolus]|uniref:zinc finger protein 599-like n=1 Tax=Engraulis encrasicolus TaxID=184585 RepID=UPI002FD472ED